MLDTLVTALSNFFKRRLRRKRFPLHHVGFHGDKYLLYLVDHIMQLADFFIETGTNVGSTIVYVARTYPSVQCFSCEPDPQAFQCAMENIRGLPNITIRNTASLEFLEWLRIEHKYLFQEEVLFWLDAHGYGFKWPLREEVAFITENFKAAYILIDDFKVPGFNHFGYSEYDGQECSFDYIKVALNPNVKYNLCYPNYKEKTSLHHSLRGWGLIEFGHNDKLILPQSLQDRVTTLHHSVRV